jgi:hypothetical protein
MLIPMAFAVVAKPLKQDKAAKSNASFFMMSPPCFVFFSLELDAFAAVVI